MASSDQRQAFGARLAVALVARGWSQQKLGVAVGVSQSAVSQWCSGQTEPDPDQVFRLEAELRLPPGDLAQLLGYLPVQARERPPPSVIAAIREDPLLAPGFKRALLGSYREFVAASESL